MTRTELEKHLGKRVRVTLFDEIVQKGVLHKTGEECFKDEPNLYIPRNYYFCGARGSEKAIIFLFKVSHIKKLKVWE